jgi:ketosteroid isomerase-like protein
MKNAVTPNEATQEENINLVLKRHLNSFLHNDLELLMSDYNNDSVLVTQDTTYKGPVAIKSFFTGLVAHFPTQQSKFELDKLVIEGNMAFITWHAKTPTVEVTLGTDTFFITEGKIVQQTFAGQMNFLH